MFEDNTREKRQYSSLNNHFTQILSLFERQTPLFTRSVRTVTVEKLFRKYNLFSDKMGTIQKYQERELQCYERVIY